jgi:Tol biopolymer transport system component
MDRDGSNPVQLTNGKEQSNWAQVTPDGRWIIYEHVGEGSLASLWKVPIEGGTPVRLTAQLSMRASISRDGKLVAYWQKEQSPGALWRIAIVPTEAGGTIKSFSVPQSPTNGNTGLRWTPDGSSIIFMDYRDGITSFWAQPIDGSAPRKISEVANNQIYAFDVDRDGRYIFSRGLRTNDVVLITDSHR